MIENVLSPEELAALNQLIDEQELPTPERFKDLAVRQTDQDFLLGENRSAIY